MTNATHGLARSDREANSPELLFPCVSHSRVIFGEAIPL